MWTVEYVAEANEERNKLVAKERVAIDHAVDKLKALGPDLPFPHQSGVRGAAGIRELRPRGGRSAWRALYTRFGDMFLILAIAPEAKTDPTRFNRAMKLATKRFKQAQRGEEDA